MENWLEIVIGIYLLCMILYGHHKGFVKMAVSMVALGATLVIVHLAMPQVAAYVKQETPVYQWLSDRISETLVGDGIQENAEVQRKLIEESGLPKDLKELLIENNHGEVYDALGVERFADYVGGYLAGVVVHLAGYVILFLIIYVLLRLVLGWLDLMARLPILNGMNQIAGALLGGLQGLFILWLLSLLLTACSGMGWAQVLLAQIENSKWLSFFYHYNIIAQLFLGLIRSIAA